MGDCETARAWQNTHCRYDILPRLPDMEPRMSLVEPPITSERVSYAALARLFLRLSLLAFGGPVAHVAMMDDELVVRRQWLSRPHFLDLLAATNLIPGPNSTEVAIHVGYTLRGISGAFVTGFCFIFPSFVLTLILAVLYVASGAIPQVESLLWGIKPAIIAIIAVAAYRLAPAALGNRALAVLFVAGLVAAGPLDIPEVVVMVGSGVLYAAYRALRDRVASSGGLLMVGLLALLSPAAQAAQAAATSVTAGDLFWYFLRIGAVLFGTGYVLIAYIQQDLVVTFGWLTAQQLLDAVAIGQLTPGPVSTTAAVVGYIVAGFPGAVAAIVGMFLPSFLLVILTAPLIPKMRGSRFMGDFLSGVNAGVVAAILITVLMLADEAFRTADGALSPLALLLFALALVGLIRIRLNATWLILAGALVGLLSGQM